MNYDTMQAGSEVDVLVAERVMGWTHVPDQELSEGGWSSDGEPVPNACLRTEWAPSTDIGSSWMLVGERRLVLWRTSDLAWHATLSGDGWMNEDAVDIDGHDGPYGHGETAPLAICRAALKALA